MKTSRKMIASAAAILMLFQCGCKHEQVVHSQNEQIEITLSWWGNDTRTEYTLEAVQLFQEAHPNIKVKCSYSEWSGYEARSRIRMVSETESDVMQINVGWLDEYSPDGTGYYDLSNVTDIIDLSNFPEDVLKYGTRNGVLNAVPIAMNTQTVYINKTIFDKYGLDIPKTWDDYFEAAKVLSKDGIYPIAGVSKSVMLMSIAYTEQLTGKTFLDEEGNIAFGEDELKIMIEFYVKMANEKVIPKIEDFTKTGIENGTYAGTVAWVSDAMNYYSKLLKRDNEIVVADYPAFEDSASGEGWYEKPATLYAMSKNTEHPREAALLMDFLLNDRENALLQGVEKGIPISKSARKYLDDAGQLNGLQYEASELMDSNDNIKEMSPLLENTNLINAYNDACNLVLYGKADADEAAAELYAICVSKFSVK
ncbi:MAG: ABC transporter substrate-binding protein [Ruminococcus sp.]|nr:ABC transporter substrate-binding protein [Ruminococcus sp.]